ncbi:MAG: PRC-barrel domain-containing protein [Phycisphaerae bacterium]|jgi:hypothetical protein
MLRSLNSILRYEINATDADLGKVDDFFFDDSNWRVRYFVVDTARWLGGRRVLISPVAVDRADWAAHQLCVNLTKDQVEKSPGIEADEPVSRQMEKQLTSYYAWPVYWGPPGAELSPALAEGRARAAVAKAHEPKTSAPADEGECTLRSIKEVTGYKIEAADGGIGHVEDFIADEEDWTIRYMVVDTRNWLPGKKVLIAPWMIRSVRWGDTKVHLEMTRDQVRAAPEYDPSAPVNREYESRFYDYYGRPEYWH